MDSIILLFIILFWVIGLVSKFLEKSNPHREEKLPKEFSLFQPRLEPVYIEQKSEQTPKIESKITQKEPGEKIVASEEKIVIQKPVTIDAGITLENVLKSTSSLKKAIILAEILNKPVCLR